MTDGERPLRLSKVPHNFDHAFQNPDEVKITFHMQHILCKSSSFKINKQNKGY